jgi:hypothetical protein
LKKNKFYCLTGTDQDYRCFGLRGFLSKISFLENNPLQKLSKIGLYFDLQKKNFKFFYSRGIIDVMCFNHGKEEGKASEYAEFVCVELFEPIELKLDLLITRGQNFYEKRNKTPEYGIIYRNLENYCNLPENLGVNKIKILGGPPDFFRCLEREKFLDFE